MKVQIKIAGPEGGTVPVEAVAHAIARAQATVREFASDANKPAHMNTTAPTVHAAIRRSR